MPKKKIGTQTGLRGRPVRPHRGENHLKPHREASEE